MLQPSNPRALNPAAEKRKKTQLEWRKSGVLECRALFCG
jgi:hypothetical protein